MLLLKRIGWLLSIVGLSVLIGSLLLTIFFQNSIAKKVVVAINESLTVPLRASTVDLSIWSDFPKISVNIKKVSLGDALGGHLIKADRLSLSFGLFSLFSDEIELNNLLIENGELLIRYDKKGRANYLIAKKGNKKTNSSAEVKIDLTKARFRNVRVQYVDEAKQVASNMLFNQAVFAGKLSSVRYELRSKAIIASKNVSLNKLEYLKGVNIEYDLGLVIDTEKGDYKVSKGDFKVNGSPFQLTGAIQLDKNSTNYDLNLKAEDADLASILPMFPSQNRAALGDFKSKGGIHLVATINGKSDAKTSPSIQANFSLRNGTIQHPLMADDLTKVNFSASFTNGKSRNNKTSVFEVQSFKGQFGNKTQSASCKISQLDDPYIQFSFNGGLPLSSVYGLISNGLLKDGQGEIALEALKVEGRYKDMTNPSRVQAVEASGKAQVHNVVLQFPKDALSMKDGSISLSGNEITLDHFNIEGAGSKMVIDGTLSNFLPYIFGKNQALRFGASLQSPMMDLEKIIALTDQPENRQQKTTETEKPSQVSYADQLRQLMKGLDGSFKADIKKYSYDRIKGEDFIGSIQFDKGSLLIKGETSAMDGYFELDGKIRFDNNPELHAKVSISEVDLNSFFHSTYNFGQDVLKAEHLSGALTSRMIIDAKWDKNGNFLSKNLSTFAAIAIEDGEIKNFELFESFSDFIKVQDLRNVVFSGIQNWMEIKNGIIYMPAMKINTNAVNLTVSGRHDFDNRFDYNLKVNAGQVLVNRLRKSNGELDPLPANQHGMFNLYYKVFGNIDDYKYRYAKREIKGEFDKSKAQHQRIMSALSKEFQDVNLLEREEEIESGINLTQLLQPTGHFEGHKQQTINTGGNIENTKPLFQLPKPKPQNNNKKPVAEEEEEEYIDFEE